MRVPLRWLAEYCDAGLEPRLLAERLSMTGTEVERVGRFGPGDAEGFVVGKVVGCEQHPDADRLSVCTVDTGTAEPRTIVCGAPNVAAGQTVPVALPGAVMPDGTKLGKAKLRGVESEGMICSEAELGLSEESEGIYVIEDDSSAPSPGTPLAEVFELATDVLELEVTPNRPDCLGVYGVAREVHAVTGAPLGAAPWEGDAEPAGEDDVDQHASVTVEAPELCPRFTARVFCEVEVGPSPAWLKARLAAAGQRSISNVVDITNYVMLMTGQPLHAFDLDKVPGGELIVRTARAGEKMTTLDDVERQLDPSVVLVCDRDQPSGIAGIMGGQLSEVSDTTTRVLLEVATWNGPNILASSDRLALRSDASTRFEKGLHPELAMRAQRIASRLIVELCGARLVPGTIDVLAGEPSGETIELRLERVQGLLGMEVPPDLVVTYLERLGFGVEPDGMSLRVGVPADRWGDVTREVDLIEEVARVHDLDQHLPSTLPAARERVGSLSREQRLCRRVSDLIADAGYDEIVGWSFTSAEAIEQLRFGDDVTPVSLANPISAEAALMRPTLLPSLLDAARMNFARQAKRVALFESGRAYLPQAAPEAGGALAGAFLGEQAPPFAEPHRIAALVAGDAEPPSWGAQAPDAAIPFFELKGVLEAVAAALKVELEFAANAERSHLHPGRSADVLLDGEVIGWLGALNPLVTRDWEIPEALAFEVDLAPMVGSSTAGLEHYTDVISFPAVYEDIAVVVDAERPSAQVRAAVAGAGGELLRSAEVFDLYEGEQVGDGRKSLALRLEFRAADRTLTDEEVAERREAITAALAEIGGALRE